MEIKLRLVEKSDVDLGMKIIDDARDFLKEQGIDQWQDGYPHVCDIENDISQSKAYFVVCDDEILGYICIDFDGEKAYEKIEGKWSYDEPYVVVHRMAFLKKSRGKNLSGKVFDLVEKICADRKVYYFRIDTSNENEIMQKLLKRKNFAYCGTIYYDKPRMAFDKRIEKFV